MQIKYFLEKMFFKINNNKKKIYSSRISLEDQEIEVESVIYKFLKKSSSGDLIELIIPSKKELFTLQLRIEAIDVF